MKAFLFMENKWKKVFGKKKFSRNVSRFNRKKCKKKKFFLSLHHNCKQNRNQNQKKKTWFQCWWSIQMEQYEMKRVAPFIHLIFWKFSNKSIQWYGFVFVQWWWWLNWFFFLVWKEEKCQKTNTHTHTKIPIEWIELN